MRARSVSYALVLVMLVFGGCASKRAAPANEVTSVGIEPPMSAPPGSNGLVCWSVEGRGRAPHVAVHWSTMSQAGKSGRTFADYSTGAAYPGNATGLSPDGYALPGRFCTGVPVPDAGALYIVGHAMLGAAPGVISQEATLRPITGKVNSVETPTGPSSSGANSDVELCWTVTGNGTVPHVDLHWAYESQAAKSNRSYRSYDKGTAYPNNSAALDSQGYTLKPEGSRFCARVRLPASGLTYVVAHVVDRTGQDGLLSGEKSIGVE